MSKPVPLPSMRDAIRYCLVQLLDDGLEAGFQVTALHIRLAILELDDGINQPAERTQTPRRHVA